MQWTKDKPTAGWWWFKEAGQSSEVVCIDSVDRMWHMGWPHLYMLRDVMDMAIDPMFAGPIPPPEDAT